MKSLRNIAEGLKLAILAALGVLQISCSDDACTLNCNGDLRYPLQIGYSWQYSGEERIINFRPDNDSITEVPLDTVRRWDLTLSINSSDTLDDGTIVYIVHEVQSEGDSLMAESYQYYGNKADGLYHYTDLSIGSPLLFFKTVADANTEAPNVDFTRKSLEYPLREGLQWEYTNGFGYGSAGAIYKRVLGIGEQSVPAGTFECYAIEWFWENLPNTEHTEYISDDGLVRTVTKATNVEYTTYEYFDGIGLVDIVTEIRLTRSPF